MPKHKTIWKKFCTISPVIDKIANDILQGSDIKISQSKLIRRLRPIKGKRWIKVVNTQRCLQLKIRESASFRIINLYTKNRNALIDALKKATKKHDIHLILDT